MLHPMRCHPARSGTSAIVATARATYCSLTALDHQRPIQPEAARTTIEEPRTVTASGRCTASCSAGERSRSACVPGVDEPGEPGEQGHGSERGQCRRTRHQRRNPAQAARRGALTLDEEREAAERRKLRTSAATSQMTAMSAAAPRIAHCQGEGPPETRTSRRFRQVGTAGPEVERLTVVGEKQAGLDFGEAVTDGHRLALSSVSK